MEYNWFDETEARMGITRTATPTLTEGEDGIVCVVRARRSQAMPCHESRSTAAAVCGTTPAVSR